MAIAGSVRLGGPIFERDGGGMRKVMPSREDIGAHYSVWHFDAAPGFGLPTDSVIGMETLKRFLEGLNESSETFVLFGTSGVHGSYSSLEDIEACIEKYGEEPVPDHLQATDYVGRDLTVLIVQTRLVCLRCGNVRVTKADIPFLKSLRELSRNIVAGYFPDDGE